MTLLISGHQRAIMGTMTVEDIYKNRTAFSEQVLKVYLTETYLRPQAPRPTLGKPYYY